MISLSRSPIAIVYLGIGLVAGLVASDRLSGGPAVPEAAHPPLPREWMSYGPVVKRVLPAVVCLESQAAAAAKQPRFGEVEPGFGSGVIIDSTGIVLTNYHVVANATTVEVSLQDGRKFTTRDIRRDAKSDLAILKLDTKEPLPFLEFGDSDAMEVGDRVLALGAPFGLTGSVTQGIVSAKSRKNLHLNLTEDFLQIDAAVNPGNSGGPLVNMEGKVIGLTAAIKTRTGGFQGVGLAVSSKLARAVSRELIKNGSVRRPYLGVLARELDPATAAKERLQPHTGVVITEVTPKSPAEKANIGVGDVITSLNGQDVTTPAQLEKAILGMPIGKKVPLLVVRNGVLFRTSAAADEQVDPPPGNAAGDGKGRATIQFENVGVSVAALTVDAAARSGLPKDVKGVVVASVTRGGLAEQSGLARGTIILQVERSPVTTAEDFRKAVEQADREKGAVIHVLRPTGDVDFVILRGQ